MKKLLALMLLGTVVFADIKENGRYKCTDVENGSYYILDRTNKTIRDTKQGDMYMLDDVRVNTDGDEI